jgi:molybdopterin-containing oxidoreductase family iron-sulfur binding subunit
MENSTKKYWKSIDEYKNADVFVEEASKEFAEELPLEELANPANLELQSNRRDFLKVFGFSLSAATLAACTKAPVRKAIPLLNQPESLSPSIPNFYASTYFDGHDFASVVVKTREGRPIKIDANPLSVTNRTGINARVNASVLNLYDVARFRNPISAGSETTWEKQDAAVIAKLNEISAAGGAIRILTHSIVSPTTKSLNLESRNLEKASSSISSPL